MKLVIKIDLEQACQGGRASPATVREGSSRALATEGVAAGSRPVVETPCPVAAAPSVLPSRELGDASGRERLGAGVHDEATGASPLSSMASPWSPAQREAAGLVVKAGQVVDLDAACAVMAQFSGAFKTPTPPPGKPRGPYNANGSANIVKEFLGQKKCPGCGERPWVLGERQDLVYCWRCSMETIEFPQIGSFPLSGVTVWNDFVQRVEERVAAAVTAGSGDRGRDLQSPRESGSTPDTGTAPADPVRDAERASTASTWEDVENDEAPAPVAPAPQCPAEQLGYTELERVEAFMLRPGPHAGEPTRAVLVEVLRDAADCWIGPEDEEKVADAMRKLYAPVLAGLRAKIERTGAVLLAERQKAEKYAQELVALKAERAKGGVTEARVDTEADIVFFNRLSHSHGAECAAFKGKDCNCAVSEARKRLRAAESERDAHAAEARDLRAENERLRIENGMRVQDWIHECGYCGWRSEVKHTCIEATALGESHIKVCPKHPMRALESEARDLRARVETLTKAGRELNEACQRDIEAIRAEAPPARRSGDVVLADLSVDAGPLARAQLEEMHRILAPVLEAAGFSPGHEKASAAVTRLLGQWRSGLEPRVPPAPSRSGDVEACAKELREHWIKTRACQTPYHDDFAAILRKHFPLPAAREVTVTAEDIPRRLGEGPLSFQIGDYERGVIADAVNKRLRSASGETTGGA